MTPLSVVQEVGVGWVRLANTLTNQQRTVEIDTVVTALGGRAEHSLERALDDGWRSTWLAMPSRPARSTTPC